MANFSAIKQSLLMLYPFSEEQLGLFADKLTYKNLKKKELILKPKQVPDGLCFVETGSLRFYTHTEQGEVTIHFFTENLWVADLESLLKQEPSKNSIEAFEHSTIASITLRDIHLLMSSHPAFHMLNALMANLAISTKHIASLSLKNPDERYLELLSQHPDWVNRFPQKHIASYLGMTPETLSRVRARLNEHPLDI
jgi:CRP/FNR family transcriptional regulator, anaerobic regulatory protein